MDQLRERFAALPGGRVKALVALGLLAVAALIAAAVLAAGQAAGSATELAPVRAERTAAPAPTPLLVHVSGAVRRPGIVALPAGARVVDAIAAAGGPAATADTDGINLAARVNDGQQVVVPDAGAPPTAAAAAGAAGTGGPISLSTATAEQLETLPRIGPAMAARILAYRDAHGFATVDDLGNVGGIGPKTLEALRDLVVP
ncbi:ComEA family DNA-binding protein [uncultured Amnibacterium sp.]|uniref:ComEA family DNA-binding protein n=1 Tax=uncultured Amnibacterium sp. TaxID=1631851 RepID=UPI0035C9BC1B